MLPAGRLVIKRFIKRRADASNLAPGARRDYSETCELFLMRDAATKKRAE